MISFHHLIKGVNENSPEKIKPSKANKKKLFLSRYEEKLLFIFYDGVSSQALL
jgi:hypothetical protein